MVGTVVSDLPLSLARRETTLTPQLGQVGLVVHRSCLSHSDSYLVPSSLSASLLRRVRSACRAIHCVSAVGFSRRHRLVSATAHSGRSFDASLIQLATLRRT